ncbi:MAG: T9SS type A sorting domain-containing protein [Bacteroidia bacterium]|nr:T9SS type A sorting domain-containing protein [Bacteroidia bacterium]
MINKSRLGLLIFLAIISFSVRSQVSGVTFQFYIDANNNCNYDAGDTLVYNIANQLELQYKDISATTQTATSMGICGWTLAVNNPSVPANNSLSILSNTFYPTISYNSTCPAYSNLSYSVTNYLPLTSLGQVGNTTLNGNDGPSPTKVCFNIGNDSVFFNMNFVNKYTCNSLASTRTYSLYLDGVLYDSFTTSGGVGANYLNGTKSSCFEYVTNYNNYLNIQSVLPSNISALGQHTLSLKSSLIYNHPLSFIDHKEQLISIPCVKVSGKFYNDCDNNCNLSGGDGFVTGGIMAKLFSATQSLQASPDFVGNFSFFGLNASSSYSFTSYSVTPSFTPCPSSTNTIVLPPGTTNSLSLGYKAPLFVDVSSNPLLVAGNTAAGQVCYPRFQFINYLTSVCPSSVPVNPGKFKAVLDKYFIYQSVIAPTPLPDNIISAPTGDTLVWNIPDFNTVFFQEFKLQAQVVNTVAIGTQYNNYAIAQPSVDFNLPNNNSVASWSIGTPFDPNNKLCYAPGIQPNGDIPIGVQELQYTINFQNVGTSSAINVISVDTLDTNLDWSTLEILGSSFPVQSQVDNSNGVTFFYFKGINLPDSNSNEPGSHGHVRYKIKLKSGVPVNTVIKNRAHNYFDFNEPIATNQTKNKLVQLAGIKEVNLTNEVEVYPNPVKDKVYLSSKKLIKKLELRNTLGQTVYSVVLSSKSVELNLGDLYEGVYFVHVTHQDESVGMAKVIKD